MKLSNEIKREIKRRYKDLIKQVNNKIISINKAECQGIDFDILRNYYNKVIINNENIIFWRCEE